MAIKFIEPIQLNISKLVSPFANSTEPLWSNATTYDTGDVVRYAHNDESGSLISYRIYTSIVDSNLDNTPPDGEIEDDKWVLTGVDNRYACVDEITGTESESTSTTIDIIVQNIDPLADIIQLINVTADVWYAIDSNSVVFASGNLINGLNGEADRRKNLTINIPAANQDDNYTIRLVRSVSDKIKLSQIIVGYSRMLDGDLEYGLTLESEDFSVNVPNEFGTTVLVERPYVKRVSASVSIPNSYFNQYHRSFASRRAKNTVWILTEEINYNETVIFGTGKCTLLANYATHSLADITIKGSI